MAIVWNNKKEQFNSSGGNGSDSFQEHNQRMRAFQLAHPENWKQRGHKVSEVRESILTLGLPALTPRVTLARYSPN